MRRSKKTFYPNNALIVLVQICCLKHKQRLRSFRHLCPGVFPCFPQLCFRSAFSVFILCGPAYFWYEKQWLCLLSRPRPHKSFQGLLLPCRCKILLFERKTWQVISALGRGWIWTCFWTCRSRAWSACCNRTKTLMHIVAAVVVCKKARFCNDFWCHADAIFISKQKRNVQTELDRHWPITCGSTLCKLSTAKNTCSTNAIQCNPLESIFVAGAHGAVQVETRSRSVERKLAMWISTRQSKAGVLLIVEIMTFYRH